MGKSAGTQKTTTETKLPEWVNKAAQDYLGQARGASQNLMSPYQGQTVAAMTPQQQQSLGRIGELSNFSLTPEAIQGQMNPYIQNVEEAALAQGRKALSQNLNQISDAGIRAGGAFGSRQGILEGVAASEQAMNQANLSAQLRQQGYQQAVQNTLAGQQAALGSAQAGYSAGALGQQQAQAELAAQEAQYNAMRGYPLEQLDIFGAALGQTPYGGTSVGRQPLTSNPLMGVIGGALAFPKNPFLGGALGGFASFPGISDRSMKTDIEKVGKDKETGLNMYSYRYKGDPKTYPKVVGPMADEIQKKYPNKVKRIGGKLAVEGNFLMGKVKV